MKPALASYPIAAATERTSEGSKLMPRLTACGNAEVGKVLIFLKLEAQSPVPSNPARHS